MAANRYMPHALWKIHGIAAPTANSTLASATGTLRMPRRSEIGPETSAAIRETTIVITDMVAITPAAAFLSSSGPYPESEKV